MVLETQPSLNLSPDAGELVDFKLDLFAALKVMGRYTWEIPARHRTQEKSEHRELVTRVHLCTHTRPSFPDDLDLPGSEF